MFKRNTKVLLGNLNLGQAGAELGTTALVVLDLLVPELSHLVAGESVTW